MYLPNIIEKTGRSTKLVDIPSKLYEEGIVTLFGEVSDKSAYSIITQLLYLDSLNDDEPVKLYINSPGGSIYAGLAIYDTIKHMKRKVDTTVFGMAASMGAFLLFSGTGERTAMPNARIMIHSAASGMRGVIHDMEIDMKETQYVQEKVMKLQAKFSNGGISYKKMVQITQRDNYLSPEETLKLGLIDNIK